MKIGNKFRCNPNPVQEHVLFQWVGCQRNSYNSKVRKDQYFLPFARNSLPHTGGFVPIDQQYSPFKTKLTPYLSEVPSVLLHNGAVLRLSPAEFVCLSCKNTDHTDHNAAKVIALRGVRQLLDGQCIQKEKKRCRITRCKVGAARSEPVAERQSTLGKTLVSRGGGNTPALWSLTQETLAPRPSGL